MIYKKYIFKAVKKEQNFYYENGLLKFITLFKNDIKYGKMIYKKYIFKAVKKEQNFYYENGLLKFITLF